ncbi:MAG TPA: hypothetical protein VMC10_00925 [Stellaceae bacterium]|nr:hypothetical protein [Stellaceae bacterium]
MASARGITRYIVGNKLPRARRYARDRADERISAADAIVVIGGTSVILWIVLGLVLADLLE